MSEIFEKPVEEVKAIEESAPAPPVKEKKKRQSHVSEERKAELKIIRVEALKRGREAKKAKREAEEASKAEAQETKKVEEKPLLDNKEIVEEKPKKEKAKPRAYKSVNNSEVELMKKEKRIKELEYENETTFMKTELSKFQNENRLLKQKLESLTIKEEAPVKEERKTSLVKKEPKRFNTRKNVFKI